MSRNEDAKPPSDTGALIEQLKGALDQARRLAALIEAPPEAVPTDTTQGIADLERRVAEYEADVKELTNRLVDSEQQSNRLLSLYSGLYQLHATLDPGLVCGAIADVLTNLAGAERFAILLFEDHDRNSDVKVAITTSPDDLGPLCIGERYIGGDEIIDSALRGSRIRVAASGQSRAIAAIPLTVDEQPVGALVLFKLLEHRASPGVDDEGLMELLAGHAASALYSAQLHVKAQSSKRRTLLGSVT